MSKIFEPLDDYEEDEVDRKYNRRAEYNRLYRRLYPARLLLTSAKQRAKELKVPFSITEDDVVIPELCPVLGEPMVIKTPMAPSIDRIDPKKGYVKGNVQVMSRLANSMKSNASPEQMLKFAEWVLKSKQ